MPGLFAPVTRCARWPAAARMASWHLGSLPPFDPPSFPNPRCLPAPLPDRPRPVDSCPVYPDPVSLSDSVTVSTC